MYSVKKQGTHKEGEGAHQSGKMLGIVRTEVEN